MISLVRRDCRPLSLRHAADLLQLLAHPIRLQILDVVRREAHTVTEIVEHLGLEQPVISRHLSILRRGGVLSAEQRGRKRIYRIAVCQAEPLLDVLFNASVPPDLEAPASKKPALTSGNAA